MRGQNTHSFRTVILIVIGLLVISCSLPVGNNTGDSSPTLPGQPTAPPATATFSLPQPTPPPSQTARPTIPVPTNPPAVPTGVRPSATAAAQDFFTEEFDGDLSNWDRFYMAGDEDLADIFNQDGRLTFYLNGEEIYAYMIYLPYSYTDVVLTTVVENRGYNNNNVSLICRFDVERGWYEFNIANSGLYWFLYYDLVDESYQYLADGGSGAIHIGKEVNEYTAVCKEKEMILYINGDEVRRFTDNKYVLKEGLVGVSVSSFNIFPIEVEFESFTISAPE